jgi:hypothetical protein
VAAYGDLHHAGRGESLWEIEARGRAVRLLILYLSVCVDGRNPLAMLSYMASPRVNRSVEFGVCPILCMFALTAVLVPVQLESSISGCDHIFIVSLRPVIIRSIDLVDARECGEVGIKTVVADL